MQLTVADLDMTSIFQVVGIVFLGFAVIAVGAFLFFLPRIRAKFKEARLAKERESREGRARQFEESRRRLK